MSANPLPYAMAPLTPPPTLPPLNRKVKHLPPKAPEPKENGSFQTAPCPSDTRPGILAAAHLAKIPFEGSSPQEPSFFAFGSTIVVEDDRGDTHTYHGNALVHLYTQPLDSTLDEPPPPPAKKTEEVRELLFRYSPGQTPGVRPHQYDHLERPFQNPRFDPKADANNPFARRLEQRLARAKDEEEELEKEQVAEALLSLRNERNVVEYSAKQSTRDQGNRAHPSAHTTALSRETKFVKGETIPGTLNGSIKVEELDAEANPFVQGVQQHRSKEGVPEISKERTSIPSKSPPVPNEPADVEMALGIEPKPSKVDAPAGKTEDAKVSDPRLAVIRIDPDGSTHHISTTSPTKPNNEGLDKFVSVLEWRKAIGTIEVKIRNGSKWTDDDVKVIFKETGLTDWWEAIREMEEKAGRKDWHAWRVEAVARTAKKLPTTPVTRIVSAANSIVRVGEANQPLQIMAIRSIVSTKDEDVDMDVADVPPPPNPSPTPTWTISASAHSTSGERTKPRSVDSDEMDELKTRVFDLEDYMEKTKRELRREIDDLKRQTAQEEIELATLKWKAEEWMEKERTAKGGGKREYRKAKGKAPTHHYPTRLTTKITDEIVEANRKELGDVAERIQAMAGRIDGYEKEIKRLQADLAKVEELAPKIEALSAAFESFRTNQIKINLGTIQEFARIRSQVFDSIEPRLVVHARDVADLNARYHALYALAMALLGQQQVKFAAAASKPPHSSPFGPFKGSQPNSGISAVASRKTIAL